MKNLTPVRLIKNDFYEEIRSAELAGSPASQIKDILGKYRAKKGIFEGDLEQGELEIGQVSASIKKIQAADEILREIWNEFQLTCRELGKIS
jgi:enoyl-[acyl-carrier protein] reductase II